MNGWVGCRKSALAGEAAGGVISEHVVQMALADAALMLLPEGGVEQVGVVFHEHGAHLGVAEQKLAEGLGKHVVRTHGVPGLGGHFVFFVARRGHAAEVAVGDVLDLVVVVEHHLAVAGDAEVLPQHVAGKDIGRHHVLDGVAVFDDGGFELGVVSLLQIDVQRNHAPLDVAVPDDDGVAVVFELRGAEGFDLLNQLGREARALEGHVRIFQRLGHAAHAVVLFHQQVLALDLVASSVFLRRIEVFDDFEHKGKGR